MTITNRCATKKLSKIKCAAKWKRLGIPGLEGTVQNLYFVGSGFRPHHSCGKKERL
jgi:hypothetical protein